MNMSQLLDTEPGGATTNAFSSYEFQRRAAGAGSTVPAIQAAGSPGPGIKALSTPLSILAITESDVIYPDARAVVCPAVAGSGVAGLGVAGLGVVGPGVAGSGVAGLGVVGSGVAGSGVAGSAMEPLALPGGGGGGGGTGVAGSGVAGSAMEPLALPGGGGGGGSTGQEVMVARQSSGSTDFVLELGGGRRCRFYYDVSSDNIIAFNSGHEALHAVALETNAADADGKFGETARIPMQGIRPLSPGYWRLMSDKGGCASTVLAELLLFRRRFFVHKSRDVAAGSKRSASDADTKAGEVSESQGSSLEVCTKDNPFLDLRPGTKLSIKSPDAGDTFTISNHRDIVKRTVTMVFRGKHSEFGDSVVKIIKTKDYSPEKHDIIGLVRAWRREVKFLESVSHPSIVKLYRADSRFFAVFMEYLPYPDLSAQADKVTRIFEGSSQDAVRILSDMAGVLVYLAERKILHNDIKPGNIVFDRDRGAVLIDFGTASEPGAKAGGTPQYMAPETLSNIRVPASDVFALGVTLLYLLKKIPLPEGTVPAWPLGESVRTEAWLARVAAVKCGLCTNGIEGIVERMLEETWQARISAREIIERLEHLDVSK